MDSRSFSIRLAWDIIGSGKDGRGREERMKRFIQMSVMTISILMACALPGEAARGRGAIITRSGPVGHTTRVGGHFYGGGHYYGGGWRWGPAWSIGFWGTGYPYYGYPYYDYPYYRYYDAPPVIIEQPPAEVYVEPDTQQATPEEPIYWYFCQEPQGYYPYVKECPNGWMKVVPSAPSSQK